MEDRHVLCGTFFFLSDQRIEHSRIVFDIMALLSEVGGLAGVIFGALAFLCIEITHVHVIDKFIRRFYTNKNGEIYFLDSEKWWPTHDEIDRNETIGKHFTYLEMISKLWWMKPFTWCLRGCDCMKNADQFQKYFYMTLHDLDFFMMYERVTNIEQNESGIR